MDNPEKDAFIEKVRAENECLHGEIVALTKIKSRSLDDTNNDNYIYDLYGKNWVLNGIYFASKSAEFTRNSIKNVEYKDDEYKIVSDIYKDLEKERKASNHYDTIYLLALGGDVESVKQWAIFAYNRSKNHDGAKNMDENKFKYYTFDYIYKTLKEMSEKH